MVDLTRLLLLFADSPSFITNATNSLCLISVRGSPVKLHRLLLLIESLRLQALSVHMMPFYLPGLIMMGLCLIPYTYFNSRMRTAKSIELSRIGRALIGDRTHLASSLISEDTDRLTLVDLMH